MDKIPVTLKNVEKTLLLPLWGRAIESQKEKPFLKDEKAAAIMNSMDFDFSKIAENVAGISQLSWIGRALVTDRVIGEFIKERPAATIVNVGCGLDTTFERVDNGTLRWFDMDLPDVMELRKRYFTESERRKFITSSFLDEDWFSRVGEPGEILFVAGGVFYYFDEDTMKDFFVRMAEKFHGSEFLFDVASPAGVRAANRIVLQGSGMDASAILKWGLKNPKDIEKWDRDIKILNKHSFFTGLRPSLDFRTRMGTYMSDFLKIMYMIHLRIE